VTALSSKTTTNSTTSDTVERLFVDRRRFTEQTRFQSQRLYSSDRMHVVEALASSAVPPLFARAFVRHQVGAPIAVGAGKESEQAVHRLVQRETNLICSSTLSAVHGQLDADSVDEVEKPLAPYNHSRTRSSQPAASPAARPTCTEHHEHLARQTPSRPRTPAERLFVDQRMLNEQPECLSPSPRFQSLLLHSSDRTYAVDAARASAARGDGEDAAEGDAMEVLHDGVLLEQLPQDAVQQVGTLVQGPQSPVARALSSRLAQMRIRSKSGPRNRDEDPEQVGPSKEGMSDEQSPATFSTLPPKPMPTLRIVATPRMYTPPHYTPRWHSQKGSWAQDLLYHFKNCERLFCTCLLLPQVC
jgi:hypothetical protein